MRILLITENLGSGGAERQLTGLAVLLKQRGYEVKVVTYLEMQFYESYLVENGVDYEFHPELLNRFTRVFYLAKLCRKWHAEVVISYLSATNVSMCLTRMWVKFRLIVSERSHTLRFDWRTSLRYYLYQLADYVVPNSFSEAENIVSHFECLRRKMVPVPNFVDVAHFRPMPDRKRNEVPLVLCVGRLIPSKNVLRLIEAVKRVVEKGYALKVVWVGKQYDGAYLSQVKGKIEDCNLQTVFFLKDQTNDILSEYQQADVFCLPTLYEGYPNVICEAMSCGLPVICSRVCENPKIVVEGMNGFLFDPLNIEDMAKCLIKVMTMTEAEAFRMSQKNRESVVAHNSKDAFVDKYIKLIG